MTWKWRERPIQKKRKIAENAIWREGTAEMRMEEALKAVGNGAGRADGSTHDG